MKPWKIIAVAAFAVIGVALVTAAASAYMGGQTAYNPYAPYGPGQGMRGGMMGNGYSPNGGYQAYPQQTPYGQQYGPWTSGHGGCPMRY